MFPFLHLIFLNLSIELQTKCIYRDLFFTASYCTEI